jgi:molybdopterin-biosynthesis enzyme MoeA-like protein
MSAEVICVGTELLLGDILNSNSQYLAQELAALGVAHFFQTVVGDNIDKNIPEYLYFQVGNGLWALPTLRNIYWSYH